MRRYLDSYPDLFWDLHLGVKGDGIPDDVRQIGQSFNTVLDFRDPSLGIVYENYMKVRQLRTPLKEWISRKNGRGHEREKKTRKRPSFTTGRRTARAAKTSGPRMSSSNAFITSTPSQWGDMVYNIMLKLEKSSGDPAVKALVQEDYEARLRSCRCWRVHPASAPRHGTVPGDFSNPGSISSLHELMPLHAADRYAYAITPHAPRIL